MNNTLPPILSLVLLAIGIIWKFSHGSPAIRRSACLVVIGIFSWAFVYMPNSFEADPSTLFLAGAILLSGFCTFLSQSNSQQASETYSSTMVILALSLGVLLSPQIVSNIFLGGFLGFIAISINRRQKNTFRTKIIFLHIAVAILFTLTSAFSGDTLQT